MEPWDVALRIASGDPQYYPLGCYQDESNLLNSLLQCSSNDNRNGGGGGTSLLLLGPSNVAKLALIRKTLQVQKVNTKQLVVHLHGIIQAETGAILTSIQAKLDNGRPATTNTLRTFEEMSLAIEDWLSQDNTKRLIIILQAFDRFAANCQHFLYTIFELTFTHQVYVIGLCTQCDAIDMLEKRVKSRFSQNIIYLPHPKTFQVFHDTIKMALSGIEHSKSKVHMITKAYQSSVESIINNKIVIEYLEAQFELSHDPIPALSIFVDALACCSKESASLNEEMILEGISNSKFYGYLLEFENSQNFCLAEWCVLVAFKRAKDKNLGGIINFDCLYEEYSQGFSTCSNTNDTSMLARRFSRTVIRAAIDILIARGLIWSNRSEAGETILAREELFIRVPLSLLSEMVNNHPGCPTLLKKLMMEIL